MDRLRKIIFIVGILGVCSLAWMIQSQILLNWDVSWLMHATQRLLAGGTYTKDFFEINPPMILYLYIPPVLLAKLTNLPIYTALQIYIFFLAVISFLACSVLIKKILIPQDKAVAALFLFNLAIVFLILPVYEFGQREHLLLMLSAPYILLFACRLKSLMIKPNFALSIGIAAGLVFALKPYFLITPLLLELYAIKNSRQFFYWARIENLAICLVLLVYAVIIFTFHSDYLFVVVPRVMHIYYTGFGLTFNDMISIPIVFYCGFGLFFYYILRQEIRYKKLCAVLAISVMGFTFSYFMQQTAWYYHLLPMFGFACLLLSLMFCLFVTAKQKPGKMQRFDLAILFFLLLIGGLFFYFSEHKINNRFIYLYPGMFAIIYGFFYSMLILDYLENNFVKKVISMFCYSLSAFLLIYFLQVITESGQVSLIARIMFLSVTMLFVFFVLKSSVARYRYILLPALGACVFVFPICWSYDLYMRAIAFSEEMNPLIIFLQEQAAHRSVYIFSTMTAHMFPAVDYADVTPATRFAFMGWIPAAVKNSNPTLEADVQFFNDALLDDLNREKPEFILVDVKRNKAHLYGIPFDYFTYFAENPEFQKLWRNYHYVTTIEEFPSYKLQVYKYVSTKLP